MAYPFQLGFQDATSPIMDELLHFRDHTFMIMFMISSLLLHLISSMLTTRLTHTSTMDAQEVETIWTILPIILITIALPSLRILYMMDEINNPSLTIKTLGHHWYWSYEYTNYADLCFDSYGIPTPDLNMGDLHLLEVDNQVVLPMETTIRTLISSEDVLHSWAIPSLGLKTDSIPGQLSQTTLLSTRPGLYDGQCSEICGSNHSFMPIVLEMVTLECFEKWSASML